VGLAEELQQPLLPPQLLILVRRLGHAVAVPADALACPHRPTPTQSIPMEVLDSPTDPEVIRRILGHLSLATCAPPLAKAWSPVAGEVEDPDFRWSVVPGRERQTFMKMRGWDRW